MGQEHRRERDPREQSPVRQEDRTMKSLTVVVERKQFTLALRENHRGRYLRITEENNGRFNTVVVPADDKEAIGKFVESLEALRTLAAS